MISQTDNLVLGANGDVHCNQCTDEVWCVHVKRDFVNHADSALIWHKANNGEYLTSLVLLVPMFPESGNIWVEVDLRFRDSSALLSVPIYSAWISNPTISQSTCIGYITPGEGRAVIRNLIIEFMRASGNPGECKSPAHNYAAQMQWERDKRTSRAHAQIFSVWWFGKCLSCVKGSVLDDDLIPGKQRSN